MKKIIIGCIACAISGFAGALAYEVFAKPDGTIYLDPEDKQIYAALKKDPDSYKNLSRLIFVYKKTA